MIYCMACKRFLAKESVFCPGCGGSVGGVRCKNGHTIRGAQSAEYCSVCRSRKFVGAAPTVNLGCVSRLLAWLAVILLVKAAFSNIESITSMVWNFFIWVVGCKVVNWLFQLFEVLLAIRIFVWFVSFGSKEFAAQIDPFPKVIPALFRLSGKFLLWLLRALLYLVEGRQLPAKNTKRLRKETTEKS